MARRGQFRADEPQGQRWAVGLQLLREGKRVNTRDVVIDCADPKVCVIEVCTSAFRNTKEQAERDLAEAQSHLDALRRASSEFDALLGPRVLEHVYVYDDEHTCVELGRFDPEGTFHPTAP